jgi:HAD superfamily hydrolase (TIGR01509 family)
MNGEYIPIETKHEIMSSQKMMKAVLFDMDGVLLDSEEYICRAGIMMFKEKGYEVSPEDFQEFTGMGENRYLGGVAQKHGIPFELEKDKARTYAIYGEIVAGKLKPFEGVVEFIEKCRSRGLKLAVASSADPPKVTINLEEIEHKKPSPDIFLKAAANLGVDARECLVIEDAVSGVSAGKAAGARVLALTTSFSAEELKRADWIAGLLNEVGDEVLDW